MQFPQAPKVFFAALFLFAAAPMFAQVKPSGYEGKLPLVVGVGISDYRLDWGYDALGHRRPIYGGAFWIDWNFYGLPRKLNGLGVELEGEDLSKFGPIELTTKYPGDNASMRHDTVGGGALYTWRHFRKISPYGKFLLGYGSIDFSSNNLRPNGTPYTHDTRTIYEPGGGATYALTEHLSIKADYEYQFWPHFLGHANPLNPSGATVGATWAFTPLRVHGIHAPTQ
jgi:opacity protein-like surface antigen